jgi:hypothetical protein
MLTDMLYYDQVEWRHVSAKEYEAQVAKVTDEIIKFETMGTNERIAYGEQYKQSHVSNLQAELNEAVVKTTKCNEAIARLASLNLTHGALQGLRDNVIKALSKQRENDSFIVSQLIYAQNKEPYSYYTDKLEGLKQERNLYHSSQVNMETHDANYEMYKAELDRALLVA